MVMPDVRYGRLLVARLERRRCRPLSGQLHLSRVVLGYGDINCSVRLRSGLSTTK